jgi:hypothetical protein
MKHLPINPEKWYRPQELVRLLQRTADAILHIVRIKGCSIRVINDELQVYGKDVLDAINGKNKNR